MTYDSMKRGLAALGLVAVAAGAASAQTTGQQASAGPRWHGWTGCWAPVAGPVDRVSESGEPAMTVCISPTASAEVVDVTTIAGGKVVSQQKLDASGREQPLVAKGCTGVQRGAWSADERRLYLKSSSNCDGLRTTTSAILSMTATGEWLDVRGVNAYGDENVRIARYRDAGIPAAAPAEIAAALRAAGTSENARIAAGAPLGTSAVIEASHSADSAVVAAWLLERGQPFTLNAPTLLQLSRSGVPSNVSDAMVAVSYPRAFQVARADRLGLRNDERDVLTGRRITAVVDRSFYDPYGWGYSAYGYGPSRYGYGYGGYGGYGYNGYGYGYGGGYYGGYSPPIIIIKDPGGSPGSRGQVVKGRGYTQNGATSQPPPSSSAGQTSTTPPPSSSTPSSSSSSGSSSSSESGRTAHARP
ncbi:MAG: hypothetical protein JWL95_2434 [Gemmatimonadetes bacterium]|nr:hypothetical protein [Gemmatimonadota bacterium]